MAHGSEPVGTAGNLARGELLSRLPAAARALLARSVQVGAPVALGFALLSAVLLALLPRTGFRDPSLGWVGRLCLLAGELALASALGLAAGGLVALYERLAPDAAVRRRALRAFAIAVVWFLTFAYASSWALFSTFGSFLDSSSLGFALGSAKLLVKHVLATNPVLLFLLPVAALGSVLAARKGLGWLLRRPRSENLTRRACAGVVLLSLVGTAAGELVPADSHVIVRDSVLGTRLSLGRAYRTARTHRSGPLSHFVFLGSRDTGAAIVTEEIVGRRVHPVRKKQVPLDDWVKDLAPAGLKRWNVVIVLFDSAQPSVLRSLGGSRDVMPALDRLAERSLRFSMYAQASHSNYADPAVLSSQYPLRDPEHHSYPKSPPYPRVLVYDVLKKLGWRTALVSSQNEYWGQMHAFMDTGGLDHFFHAESLKSATIPEADPGFSDWAKHWGYSGKIDDRETIDEAIRFVDRGGEPFFMYVNLQNSHFPYHTPEGHPRPFQPDTIDFPYSFGNYPEDKVPIVKNRWHNSLRYVDGQIARLVSHLEQKGLLERTLLVIGADNGEAFYEHGIVCHAGSLFDESVRVPVVMHGPGFDPGTYSGLSQAIDIVPTVLARLGLPPHPNFQGVDLLGAELDPSRAAYIVAQTPKADQLAMVKDGWKLIFDYWYDAYLLFHIAKDPGETRDLADTEQARLRVMASELRVWERAQLEYYRSAELMKTTYPPVLVAAPPPR